MLITKHSLASFAAVVGALVLVAVGTATADAHEAHAKISQKQARAAALKKYPGKVEGKIKLENEEGSWQYAVNVRSGKILREVMVNANTGKIANVEVTTKAEEEKEAKAEASKAMKHAGSTHRPTGKR